MDDKKKSMIKSSSDVFNFTSEVRRLERNIGDFTRKLEHERRASILLDKEIEEMTKALNEKKQGYTEVRSMQKKLNKDHISEIEEQLELTMRQISNIRASNQRLREKIDSIRKDKNLCSKDNKKIENDIKEARKQIKDINGQAINFQKTLDTHNLKIMTICKSQEENNSIYSSRMDTLQSQILNDRKEGSKFLKDFTVKFAKPIADASELFQLTKNSAKIWKERCFATLQDINKYQDFVKELSNGLTVMQKHSGKKDYNEIVDEYIETFEENIKLSNHVYELGEEIIHVTDEINMNEDHIKTLNSTRENEHSSKEKILKEKSSVLASLKEKNEGIKKETMETKKKLKELIAPIIEMQRAFKETNLPLRISREEPIEFDLESSEIDMDNMKVLLKQLEEYIDQLVLVKASTNDGLKSFFFEMQSHPKGKNKPEMIIDDIPENDDYVLLSEEDMKKKAMEALANLDKN